MKILILHPEFENLGGVSNLFNTLKGHFKMKINHFIVGRRVRETGPLSILRRFFGDYVSLFRLLRRERFDVIHINPSLNFKGSIRDGIFISLARIHKIKIVVFFHGWDKDFERKLTGWKKNLFKKFYIKVDAFIVLANDFKERLIELGFRQPIYTLPTAVDENLLKDFSILSTIEKRLASDHSFQILYLARIVNGKGIYETVNAFRLLRNKYPQAELVIAGDGEDLRNLKDYVINQNISGISFPGYVKDLAKRAIFEHASLYCFPTFYEEGMPISLLEAMSFGLPVITRPVGGVADFFQDGKHGFITESLEPEVFANLIEKLILDKNLYRNISLFNYEYAQKHFLASKVVREIERIYISMVDTNK